MDDKVNQPPPLPPNSSPETPSSESSGSFQNSGEKICKSCGSHIKLNTLTCPYCGKSQVKKGMGCLPKAAIAAGILMFLIPVIGILAAIAIPNFIAYKNKAIETSVRTELNLLVEKENQFFEGNQRYTGDLNELGYASSNPEILVEVIKVYDTCYDARGTHEKDNFTLWVDCFGDIRKENRLYED